MSRHTIELDCPPFSGPRPNDLIEGVLEGTGLQVADFHTGPPFFGHQVWLLKSADKDPVFMEAKPVLAQRIAALFHSGTIRYGSW